MVRMYVHVPSIDVLVESLKSKHDAQHFAFNVGVTTFSFLLYGLVVDMFGVDGLQRFMVRIHFHVDCSSAALYEASTWMTSGIVLS